jgi:hypothetical protein
MLGHACLRHSEKKEYAQKQEYKAYVSFVILPIINNEYLLYRVLHNQLTGL